MISFMLGHLQVVLFNYFIFTFFGKREVNMEPVTKGEATGWWAVSHLSNEQTTHI